MGLKELKSKSREQRSYGPFPGAAILELAKFDLLSRITIRILKELRANFGAATLGCCLTSIVTPHVKRDRIWVVVQFPFPQGRTMIIPYKPLPFPRFRPLGLLPRPRRLPKGKRVTIAAGFVCFDGIVLCADTQETIPGYTKNSTEKIRFWKDGGLGIAITGSGDSELIATAGQLLEQCLTDEYLPSVLWLPENVRTMLQDTWKKFFQDCIVPYAAYPRDDRPSVDLLIGIGIKNERVNWQGLFKASGTTIRQIDEEGGADCIGSGSDYC